MATGVTVLLAVNAVVAACSVAFALVAAVHPAALSHTGVTPDAGERFYVWMYVARALPLGLLTGIAPLTSAGTVSMFCLIAAAVVQLADAAVGWSRGEWMMLSGAACAAVVHGVAAFAIG